MGVEAPISLFGICCAFSRLQTNDGALTACLEPICVAGQWDSPCSPIYGLSSRQQHCDLIGHCGHILASEGFAVQSFDACIPPSWSGQL